MRTTWDRYREPNSDDNPYEPYSAWERWMEAEDEKNYQASLLPTPEPGIMETIEDIHVRIDLYSRFCDAAYGAGLPWHSRLWDVLTEPVVKGWWKLHSFRHDLRRDLKEVVRSVRAGRWPESTGPGSWTLYRRDPATGLPVVSCYRGAFAWERAIPWSRANRRRRAAIRARDERKTEGATP